MYYAYICELTPAASQISFWHLENEHKRKWGVLTLNV